MEGYIKLHREIFENHMYLNEPFNKMHAWIDLLLIANHKSRFLSVRGNMIKVERGQVGWSKERLAKRWQWSRNKVKRFLNVLEMEQQIEQQKSNVLGLITIINYNKYQGDEPTDEPTNGHQTDIRRTTNKNDKNVKNEKKEVYMFDSWYGNYPKKVSRGTAEKAWNKLSDTDKADAITGLKRLLPSLQLTDRQYIPMPSTWLNGKRWMDEITENLDFAWDNYTDNELAPILKERKDLHKEAEIKRPTALYLSQFI